MFFKWLGRYYVEYSRLQSELEVATYIMMDKDNNIGQRVIKSLMIQNTMHQSLMTFLSLCNEFAKTKPELDESFTAQVCQKAEVISKDIFKERNHFAHSGLFPSLDEPPEDPMEYKFIRRRIKTSKRIFVEEEPEFNSHYLIEKSLEVRNFSNFIHVLGRGVADEFLESRAPEKVFTIGADGVTCNKIISNLGESL